MSNLRILVPAAARRAQVAPPLLFRSRISGIYHRPCHNTIKLPACFVSIRYASSSWNARGTPSHHSSTPSQATEPERPTHRHPTFDIAGRVYVVTGGARGLGLTMAETLAENGAHAYCLDVASSPSPEFDAVKHRLSTTHDGSLSYSQVDVRDPEMVETTISRIASTHSRLDGLAAAAGIQYVTPALEYPPDKIDEMLDVNYKGVYLCAVSSARQMVKYRTSGAILLVGSTGGLNAIKGLNASVYSSSKAGVIQLARSLAMEWGKIVDGKPIRVNALCPGNIITPMVKNDFKNDPTLRAKWEEANMMGRISETKEYKGATLFLLSDASSFMTGSGLVIDGGYTAW